MRISCLSARAYIALDRVACGEHSKGISPGTLGPAFRRTELAFGRIKRVKATERMEVRDDGQYQAASRSGD